MSGPPPDPRMQAAIKMIGRTGAQEFQLRYSDDEKPIVWMAVARWGKQHEVGASLNPVVACIRLLETVIDGGECAHCHRPSGISDDFSTTMPLDDLVCWYVFDPEMVTFRRGCEGETG